MEKQYVIGRHGDKVWNSYTDFHYLASHLRDKINRENLIGIHETRSLGDVSSKKALVLYSTDKEDVLLENRGGFTETRLGKRLVDLDERELRDKAIKTNIPLEMLVKLRKFIIVTNN
ncbi:MAG: hypothetical protein IB618_02920 [Candidatus Pacearchaeota archaeon]|nr:MAG: hypothetical protein IB618_02920 [Candidatus Pacearchaeota archaeon]